MFSPKTAHGRIGLQWWLASGIVYFVCGFGFFTSNILGFITGLFIGREYRCFHDTTSNWSLLNGIVVIAIWITCDNHGDDGEGLSDKVQEVDQKDTHAKRKVTGDEPEFPDSIESVQGGDVDVEAAKDPDDIDSPTKPLYHRVMESQPPSIRPYQLGKPDGEGYFPEVQLVTGTSGTQERVLDNDAWGTMNWNGGGANVAEPKLGSGRVKQH